MRDKRWTDFISGKRPNRDKWSNLEREWNRIEDILNELVDVIYEIDEDSPYYDILLEYYDKHCRLEDERNDI